jgi:hypothetical protein
VGRRQSLVRLIAQRHIQVAADSIVLRAGDAMIADRVESISHVPMLGFNLSPNPGSSETT